MDPWVGMGKFFPWGGVVGYSPWGCGWISLDGIYFTPPGDIAIKKKKTPGGGVFFTRYHTRQKIFTYFFLAIENQSYAI